MRIVPLAMHAIGRIPTFTDFFSRSVDISTISSIKDGVTTVVTATPHELDPSMIHGVSLTEFQLNNPLIAFSILNGTDISLTTSFPHELTTPPGNTFMNDLNYPVQITDNLYFTGVIPVVSVISGTEIVVRIDDTTGFTLTGSEDLISSPLQTITGWYASTVVDETTLTFDTPSIVPRDFVASGGKLSMSVRISGALDIESIAKMHSRPDGGSLTIKEGRMYIAPLPVTRTSRNRDAQTDGITELGPAIFNNTRILDGFIVFVLCPTENEDSGVPSVDRCHGDLLDAVLSTFNGVAFPQAGYAVGQEFISTLRSHGAALYNNSIYVHQYEFECIITLTQCETLPAYQWYQDLGNDSTSNLVPVGGAPIFDITFSGIYTDENPSPLELNINLTEEQKS